MSQLKILNTIESVFSNEHRSIIQENISLKKEIAELKKKLRE